ncbi:hypothetical protein E3N88_37003 [Mikania micrantha]|uniref:Uncharacterized protein n=1 Tax=Mikania micrantha TaxID=192012 RepID=A0A5N6M807_9ASTR|nr:hypothetical protein E3N88_37003 [Mikania micrantha]
MVEVVAEEEVVVVVGVKGMVEAVKVAAATVTVVEVARVVVVVRGMVEVVREEVVVVVRVVEEVVKGVGFLVEVVRGMVEEVTEEVVVARVKKRRNREREGGGEDVRRDNNETRNRASISDSKFRSRD